MSAATTSGWYSPVRRASGVTCSSVTGDLLVSVAPTRPRPTTSRLGLRELLGHELGEPDRAAGARNVLHLHAGGQPALLQHLLRRPGQLVVAAAGAGRGDDLKACNLSPGRGDRCDTASNRRSEQRASRDGRAEGVIQR